MDITLHITKFPFSSEQSPKKEKFDKIIGSSTPDNSRTCQLKRQQLVHLRPIYPHQSSLKSFHSGFLVPMFEQVGWRRVWRKGCPGHHAPAARCHHSYHAPARSSSSFFSSSSSLSVSLSSSCSYGPLRSQLSCKRSPRSQRVHNIINMALTRSSPLAQPSQDHHSPHGLTACPYPGFPQLPPFAAIRPR